MKSFTWSPYNIILNVPNEYNEQKLINLLESHLSPLKDKFKVALLNEIKTMTFSFEPHPVLNTQGVYDGDDKLMYFNVSLSCPFDDGLIWRFLFLHELGHTLDFLYDGNLSTQFLKEYKNPKQLREDGYDRKNAWECFAEYFALYLTFKIEGELFIPSIPFEYSPEQTDKGYKIENIYQDELWFFSNLYHIIGKKGFLPPERELPYGVFKVS